MSSSKEIKIKVMTVCYVKRKGVSLKANMSCSSFVSSLERFACCWMYWKTGRKSSLNMVEKQILRNAVVGHVHD